MDQYEIRNILFSDFSDPVLRQLAEAVRQKEALLQFMSRPGVAPPLTMGPEGLPVVANAAQLQSDIASLEAQSESRRRELISRAHRHQAIE